MKLIRFGRNVKFTEMENTRFQLPESVIIGTTAAKGSFYRENNFDTSIVQKIEFLSEVKGEESKERSRSRSK